MNTQEQINEFAGWLGPDVWKAYKKAFKEWRAGQHMGHYLKTHNRHAWIDAFIWNETDLSYKKWEKLHNRWMDKVLKETLD